MKKAKTAGKVPAKKIVAKVQTQKFRWNIWP